MTGRPILGVETYSMDDTARTFGMKGVGENNNSDYPEELFNGFQVVFMWRMAFEWTVMIPCLGSLTAAIHFLKFSNFAAICLIYVKGKIYLSK